MKSKLLMIFGGIALFIILTEGLTNPFSYWNCVPVLIAYIITINAIGKGAGRLAGAIGFCFFGVGLSLFIHLSWIFDWHEIATSSSTSALVFVFLPVYSILSGGVGCLIGHLLGLMLNRHEKKGAP